jgi:hypothetical protein
MIFRPEHPRQGAPCSRSCYERHRGGAAPERQHCRWVNPTVMSPLLERATVSAAPSFLPQHGRTKRHYPALGATLRFPQGFFSSIKHSRRACVSQRPGRREMIGRSRIPPKTSGAWRKRQAAHQAPFCPHVIPVACAGSGARAKTRERSRAAKAVAKKLTVADTGVIPFYRAAGVAKNGDRS